MKKRYLSLFLVFILVGVGLSVYQYVDTFKTMVADAANTKPINGHSWAEMESDSDSIQVSGQTITNLATPVNGTDAVNKEYVESYVNTVSAGSAYSTCYVGIASSCASGFTMVGQQQGGVYTLGGVCAGTPVPTIGATWTYPCGFTIGSAFAIVGFYAANVTSRYIDLYANTSVALRAGPSGSDEVLCCK